MRPFFSYYGSKYLGARRYGPPRRDIVVEPFAGSACYATYWGVRKARLYDLSEDVCAAWDWLINCSVEDILAVPAPIRSNEEWLALPDGPRQVVFWRSGYADAKVGKVLKPWYLEWARTGKRTNAYASGCRNLFWGEEKRAELAAAKPGIAEWTVDRLSYRDIPIDEAHYFVDPPYQGKPGRAYPHNEIDYPDLADWVRSLPGSVDVCENEGADWLPFVPLYATTSMRGRNRTREVVWRNEPVDLLDLARDNGA